MSLLLSKLRHAHLCTSAYICPTLLVYILRMSVAREQLGEPVRTSGMTLMLWTILFIHMKLLMSDCKSPSSRACNCQAWPLCA